MNRCIVWGTGDDYECIINKIKYEELKGNLQCVAIFSKSLCRFLKKLDGYDIISKEEFPHIAFDYLIISPAKYFQEIKTEALNLGIPEHKIISGEIFTIANFDFKRYASLKENPVSILSDDCWGGYVYHALNLPFSSPLINIYWPRDSYCEFIKDPFFYLEQPLYMERDGDPRKNIFPIGRLGDGEKSVQLHFVHEASFQVAKDRWEKRKKRINKDRIFIKFGFSAREPRKEEYLKIFDQVPYHKVCMYSGDTDMKNVLYTKRFEWDWYHDKRLEFDSFNDWIRQDRNFTKVIDILKMLNGEPNYMREE